MQKKKYLRELYKVGFIAFMIISFVISPVSSILFNCNLSNIEINKTRSLLFAGDVLYVGGSGMNNYTQIQDAIDNASNGDTVLVYSGIYYENVVIDTSINLFGQNMYSTIIDGGNKDKFDTVHILSDGITIDGFTIQNSGDSSHDPDAGIDIGSDDNIITGNRIINNRYGINLGFSHYNIISDNFVSENKRDGIILGDQTSYNVISENIIMGNEGAGITGGGFLGNYNNEISHNQISQNSDGIYIVYGNNYLISGNIISRNGYHGIWLIHDAVNNNITGNEISYNSWGIKINAEDSFDNLITGNKITKNYYGLELAESCNNDISNNEIADSVKNGIYLYVADNNSFCHNNIQKNSPNCFFWDCQNNYWNGNYWGRFRVFPKIIFGVERSFRPAFPNIFIPRIDFDMNPASGPYDI